MGEVKVIVIVIILMFLPLNDGKGGKEECRN